MLKIDFESSADTVDIVCHAQMLGPSTVEFIG